MQAEVTEATWLSVTTVIQDQPEEVKPQPQYAK